MENKKKKDRFNLNIRWNNLWVLNAAMTVIITLIAVISIVYLMSRRYDEHMLESTMQGNNQIIENVASGINSYINDMMEISGSLKGILEKGEKEKASYHFVREDINTIAVFDATGNPILQTRENPLSSSLNVKDQEWFRTVVPGSKVGQLSSPHVQRLYKKEYPWVISLSSWIEWKENNRTQSGVMLIDMNFSNIRNLCNNELGNNGYIYITDGDGEIVYHPHQQMIHAGLVYDEQDVVSSLSAGNHVIELNGKEIVATIKPLQFNWKLVGVSPVRKMLSYDYQVRNFAVITIVVIIVMVVIIAVMLSLLITKPLNSLAGLMKNVERGNLDTFSDMKGVYEVEEISKSFNQMVYRIKLLMEQVENEQRQLRKSEIETLYSQINPHFLYNTLDSILWMAEAGNNDGVVEMIDALARFFRLSLSGGRDIITVKEELEHVENYLIIQKMRYSEQFSFSIEAQPEVLNYRTLKIVLQPIVENAVIHGVGNLPYPGKIKIAAFERADFLYFTVEDNGFGMSEETVRKVLEGQEDRQNSGIGLFNVESRIKLLCGSEYGIHIESELDEGTKVKIVLPKDIEGANIK